MALPLNIIPDGTNTNTAMLPNDIIPTILLFYSNDTYHLNTIARVCRHWKACAKAARRRLRIAATPHRLDVTNPSFLSNLENVEALDLEDANMTLEDSAAVLSCCRNLVIVAFPIKRLGRVSSNEMLAKFNRFPLSAEVLRLQLIVRELSEDWYAHEAAISLPNPGCFNKLMTRLWHPLLLAGKVKELHLVEGSALVLQGIRTDQLPADRELELVRGLPEVALVGAVLLTASGGLRGSNVAAVIDEARFPQEAIASCMRLEPQDCSLHSLKQLRPHEGHPNHLELVSPLARQCHMIICQKIHDLLNFLKEALNMPGDTWSALYTLDGNSFVLPLLLKEVATRTAERAAYAEAVSELSDSRATHHWPLERQAITCLDAARRARRSSYHAPSWCKFIAVHFPYGFPEEAARLIDEFELIMYGPA
eukprot:NODE_860_length_1857_cov_25.644358_g771_i0.p1 GENE.NODE_860_length_1857_cov_25.644358_g771_i0~~NODE_860_length_1857_cov_25.644358_g771_i0.p1  ORF type:complete len:422 (+),score=54.99 NODE_860_length_1857_cov_25.644358_g771_i0:94-1359(+)